MIYRCFFVLLAFFCTLLADEPIEITGNAEILFVLPVNWTTTPKYNLDVTIPKGFVPLQPVSEWEKAPLIEFIPKGEKNNSWTEIISINKFIGKKIAADAFVAALRDQLFSKTQNGQILEESIEKMSNYIKAMFLLSYDFQDKHEVIEVIYYSGPFDCVGIQYTVRADKEHFEEDVIMKIRAFNSSVRISRVEEIL